MKSKRKISISNDINETVNIKTAQTDMIDRNGYISIEQQYNQFTQAGINRMEWLKQAYPRGKMLEIEEANMKEEETYRKLARGIRDDLDILDKTLQARANIDKYKGEFESLKNKKLELENNLKEIKDKMESSKVDNNATPSA